jgi:ABC-type glycerol-3-phosphate transport system substrate-binding protein
VKYFVATIFLILIILTGVAFYLRPNISHDGKTQLTWLTPFTPFREEQGQVFNRLNSDCDLKVDTTLTWKSTSMQRVIMQCSSGLGPDLFDAVNNQIQNYVISGVAMDITEEAKAGGFSTDQMWPGVTNLVMQNGRQYAFPDNTGGTLLLYNKNVFDRFHIPYPDKLLTWDELFALAKKFLSDESNVNSVYGLGGLYWPLAFFSAHGQFFSEDGTQILLTAEPLRRAFQLHLDARFKDRISPSAQALKSIPSQGGGHALSSNLYLFTEGSFAMYLVGRWALFDFRHDYEERVKLLKKWEAKPDHKLIEKPQLLRLGALMVPHFADLSPAYRLECRLTIVNARSPNRDKALKFLQFLAGPDFASEINRAHDQVPGNPKYVSQGVEKGYDDLSEDEMLSYTIESMKYGYISRASPFLVTNDIENILSDQMDRLEADPKLKVESALTDAQEEAIRLMQRNLDRDPALADAFKKITGTTNVGSAQKKRHS